MDAQGLSAQLARMVTEMGRFARVTIFDKRGTGLSDRVADIPTMEERIDDMRAVMDAAGIERSVRERFGLTAPAAAAASTASAAATKAA